MKNLSAMNWTTAVVLILDQISKYIVVQAMDLKSRGVIEVLDPYLMLKMAWNRGVNFGLFANHGDATRWGLIIIALAISAWIIWWMRRDRPGFWVQVSAGLVLGGAVGNVIDRVIYGAVADFINMSCCGFVSPWSFNVADIAIFAGAIGLLLLPHGKPEGRKTP